MRFLRSPYRKGKIAQGDAKLSMPLPAGRNTWFGIVHLRASRRGGSRTGQQRAKSAVTTAGHTLGLSRARTLGVQKISFYGILALGLLVPNYYNLK